MEFRAEGRFIRLSSKKGRIIAEKIRGLGIQEAINLLSYSPKAASKLILKVLKSAIANAEENPNFKDTEKLYIKNVFVNQGPTLKRFQPRAMGRAYRIRKRTSHITVILSDK